MRVLVLTNMYPIPKYPFYGIFVKEQVESLRKEGINVDVFFINGRNNRLNYLVSFPGSFRKLNSNHYDIIHAHHTFCIYPFLISKLLLGIRIPLILTFHEGEILKPPELPFSGMDFISRIMTSASLKKWLIQKADLVISVYGGLLKILNFSGKSIVLPPGVNLELFRPMDRFECRKKIGLPQGKKILFFPADAKNPKRRTEKGFDLLQKALAKLYQMNDITLLTGGNILHKEMPVYINAADVVIQTSYFEASAMVIKESMACNTPVVSTDVGDTKDIIRNTRGCYICDRDPEDIAQKLNKALKFGEKTNGREQIRHLSLDRVANRIISIYEKILHEHRKE